MFKPICLLFKVSDCKVLLLTLVSKFIVSLSRESNPSTTANFIKSTPVTLIFLC